MARSTLTPMQLSPLVTVQDVLAETSSERLERNGLRSTATSVVRGLTLFGLIHLEEIRTVATVHAPGYRRDEVGDQPAVDATADSKRTFIGLSLTDPVTGQTTRVCTVCEDTQVVEAINAVLGSSGYARAPDPDPDYKLGTVKGTNAVVQKDRLQQTADIIGNNDDSSEWPAVEIVVYRDAERRGSGRWIIQVGGVFSQANFNVISRLGDIVDEPPLDEEFVEDEPLELLDEPFVEGSLIEGTPPRRVAVRIEQAEAIAAPSAASGGGGLGELFKRIVEAVTSLKGALLLAVLWLVVFGPVYVARRRALLQRVIGP